MSSCFRSLPRKLVLPCSSASKSYCANVVATNKTSPISLIDPLSSKDYFGLQDFISVERLFKARAYLGHKSILRNPYMTPYLFGCRQGVDIIDLDQTALLLFTALNFTAHIAYRGGVILFMSQNLQMIPLVEKTARLVGEYSYCRPWGGGVFTDSKNFYHSATRLPDLIIMLNTNTSLGCPHGAVKDAAKMLIPTVGIVDTNCDPRLVTYPVPGNDDSPVTIRLWASLFAEAISHGKRRSTRDALLRKQVVEPNVKEEACISD